jgi:hypothetical protein
VKLSAKAIFIALLLTLDFRLYTDLPRKKAVCGIQGEVEEEWQQMHYASSNR